MPPPSGTDELGLLAARVRQAGLAKTLVQAAQAERAEVLVRTAIDASSGDSLMARTPETQLAWVLMWRGKANEGYGYAHRAATHQQRHGFRTLERWSRGVMAMCAAHAGDHDAAERALVDVDALSPIPVVMWDADLWHARTLMAWLRQDVEEGQRWARFGVAESAPRGLRFDEALGWYLLARFGGAREALEPLQAFADELGGLPALFAMYASALVSHDPAELGEVAEAFSAAGIEGTSTNAARLASRWYEAIGDTRAAARWSRRSAELAAALRRDRTGDQAIRDRTAVTARAGGGRPRRDRRVESGDRRAVVPVGADRRQPPDQGVRQARRAVTRRPARRPRRRGPAATEGDCDRGHCRLTVPTDRPIRQ